MDLNNRIDECLNYNFMIAFLFKKRGHGKGYVKKFIVTLALLKDYKIPWLFFLPYKI